MKLIWTDLQGNNRTTEISKVAFDQLMSRFTVKACTKEVACPFCVEAKHSCFDCQVTTISPPTTNGCLYVVPKLTAVVTAKHTIYLGHQEHKRYHSAVCTLRNFRQRLYRAAERGRNA